MSSRMLLLWSCAVLLLASGPAWPSDAPPAEPQIVVQPLRRGLHLISGAGSNVAVWHGPDGTVLVDDGVGTLAPELLAAVEKIAPGPVRVVISTHWHPDHTGGNEHFAGSGSLLMAHDNVRARLSEPQTVAAYDLEVPAAPAGALPIVTFDDALSLHLNGDRLAALHVEAAHTDGDLVLWWEDANVVHVGDVYYSGMYPFIDLGSGGSLAGRRGCARDRAVPCRFTDDHHPGSRAGVESRRTGRVSGHARRDGPARARVDRRGQEPRRSARGAPDGRVRRRLRTGLDDRRALRRHPLRGPRRTPLRFSPRRRN